ncbi:MAG: hypothetical protein KJ630_05100 [Proteobacteria bacterium]|nr:hypothetical protein [Pseudomonadota bacterium]
MQILKNMKLAVVAVLVIGTMAIESEAQGRGIEVFLPPPPPLPSVEFSFNNRVQHRDEYRPRHRSSQVCWEEVVRVERRHGGYRNETRTVCRDRGRGHNDGGWRDEHRNRYRW